MTGLITLFFSMIALASANPVKVEFTQASEKFYNPVNITINSINLNAKVLTVGKDTDGTQLVPPDNATVSWWKYGAKPGERGSAVLAGHYKIADGSPGAFYSLNEVKIGEIISVKDENGYQQNFKVVDRKIFDINEFPTMEIYTNKDGNKLNLVTCAGKYLPAIGTYEDRLVVYTVKI